MGSILNLGAITSPEKYATATQMLKSEETTMTKMPVGENDTPTGAGVNSSPSVTQSFATGFAEKNAASSKEAGAEAFEASLEDQALLEASKKEIYDVV